jgi:hypothetical protein
MRYGDLKMVMSCEVTTAPGSATVEARRYAMRSCKAAELCL